MTEIMMATVITPVEGTYKPGSTGLPVTDNEIRIVDTETGQMEMPTGQVGEITMRCPQMMLGYYQHPTETANTIRDGWLFTGDLGYLDEDGYLFIVDRKKDVIKPSGFQVWPRGCGGSDRITPGSGRGGRGGYPGCLLWRSGQSLGGAAGR